MDLGTAWFTVRALSLTLRTGTVAAKGRGRNNLRLLCRGASNCTKILSALDHGLRRWANLLLLMHGSWNYLVHRARVIVDLADGSGRSQGTRPRQSLLVVPQRFQLHKDLFCVGSRFVRREYPSASRWGRYPWQSFAAVDASCPS